MESNSNSIDDYGDIDIYANGFKCVSEAAATCGANASYIYGAWAEHPIVTSKGVPATAV